MKENEDNSYLFYFAAVREHFTFTWNLALIFVNISTTEFYL